MAGGSKAKPRQGQPWHFRGVDVFTVCGERVTAKLAYVVRIDSLAVHRLGSQRTTVFAPILPVNVAAARPGVRRLARSRQRVTSEDLRQRGHAFVVVLDLALLPGARRRSHGPHRVFRA